MKLRLSSLADVDPLAVPLPHGTEVITRVDRVAGDRVAGGRRIDQGALGRVVGTRDGVYDVALVGHGVVAFSREELVPSKAGQLRFAHRRERAWSALRPCVVLEAVVGSRAWGLSDEDSDVDRRGVFALPFPWTCGLVEPPRDLVSVDGSSSYWEAEKALRQGIRADPNTLEMLFVASAEAHDEIGEWLLESREAFVSAEIYRSFGRYALSQLKKLNRTRRLAENRGLVVRWLRDEPGLSLDEVAARLAAASDIEAPTERDARERARQYVKQLYRSMYDQGLLPAREFAALADFARTREGAFEEPRHLRPKNAYNLLRLLDSAIHWLSTGEPRLEVPAAQRPELLAIKRGEVALAEVLEMARARMPALETARRSTPLPETADVGRIDRLLRRIRSEAARRFFAREPGPFGRDAPELPVARWRP